MPSAVLDERVPAGADAAADAGAWHDLGAADRLRPLYDAVDPRFGFDPAAVRRLLADVDGRCAVGTTLSVCVQIASAVPLLHAHRASGPAGDVLDGVLTGERRVALAATDAGCAGSDLTGLTTTLTVDDDVVEVSGTKCWIVNAEVADHALVLARHAEGRHPMSFTLVLVPLDAPGVSREPAATAAFPGSGLGSVTFDRVRVGRDHVLGGVGRGLALFLRQIHGERLASGLWAEILCRRVLDGTRARLAARGLADGVLGDNPAARQRFAAAVVDHLSLAALADGTVATGDDVPVAPRAAALKAAGARTLDSVLEACAPLWGADGFLLGGIQELRGQASMFGIAGGATPTLLELVADHASALLADPGKETT